MSALPLDPNNPLYRLMMGMGGIGGFQNPAGVGLPPGVPGGGIGMPQAPRPPMSPNDVIATQIAGQRPRMQTGILERISQGIGRGLGKFGEAMTPIDPSVAATMNPEHLKALRQQALMRTGLGMMQASQSNGLGASIAQGLGQGIGGFDQAVQQSYGRALNERQWNRTLKRDDIEDKRYTDETDYTRGRHGIEDKRYEQEREDTLDYRKKQLALEERQLDIAQQRADKSDRQTMRIQDIDRMRNEYNRRLDKVRESRNFADQIMMLSSAPNVEKDPSAQTAIVFAFGKMLDPDSVVREAEYAIIEKSRGLQEQLQAILPRLSEGARLTPDQIKRMRDVAVQYINSNKDRMDAMSDYYGELSNRRGVDPFEVTGKAWKSKEDKNTIDMSGLGGGLGGGARSPIAAPRGMSNSMQSPTGMRIVDVDF